MTREEWPEGREKIPTIEKRIAKILNTPFNGHPSREEDHQLREAVKYLAHRLQLLEQVVKAYKTGKL